MLRSLTGRAHLVYTCLCRQSQQINICNSRVLETSRLLTTSTVNYVDPTTWSKDTKGMGRKKMSERSGQDRLENMYDIEADKEEHIEGLVDSGAILPTLETHAQLFDGVRYDELPIVHIRSSMNNTILTLTNHNGRERMLHHSCGLEGYKNIKKSTTVAAQATGYVFGKKAVKMGVQNVRILVRGLGSGRLVSMKGLEMAGLNIVSITDNTVIPHNGCRPRAQRRR